MELKIIKQEKQPLLSRIEITAEISFEGSTPSRYEIIQVLSKKLKTKKELTLVKHIFTEYGSTNAEVEACVYEDPKVMEVLEKKIRKINEPKAEGPKQEQAQAEKKESPGEAPPVVEGPKPEQASAEESKQEKPLDKKQEPVLDKKEEDNTPEEKPKEE